MLKRRIFEILGFFSSLIYSFHFDPSKHILQGLSEERCMGGKSLKPWMFENVLHSYLIDSLTGHRIFLWNCEDIALFSCFQHICWEGQCCCTSCFFGCDLFYSLWELLDVLFVPIILTSHNNIAWYHSFYIHWPGHAVGSFHLSLCEISFLKFLFIIIIYLFSQWRFY